MAGTSLNLYAVCACYSQVKWSVSLLQLHILLNSPRVWSGRALAIKEVLEAISQAVQHQLGPPSCNPPKNRFYQEIHHCFPAATSGYYIHVHTPNGLTARVYCLMYCFCMWTNIHCTTKQIIIWYTYIHVHMHSKLSQYCIVFVARS